MILLKEICTSCSVHRSIKPLVLTTFGDVAMASKEYFLSYTEPIIQLLTSAAAFINIDCNPLNEDLYQYNIQLQIGIFEAFSGMLHGVEPKIISARFVSVVPQILALILVITKQINKSPHLKDIKSLKNALGLVWDISDIVTNSKESLMKLPDLIMITIKISRDTTYPTECRETAGKVTRAISKQD